MREPDTGFFSWTARRVSLGGELQEVRRGEHLEVSLPTTTRPSHLVVYHDDDEADYVALVVGDAAGNEDVPVHAVHEEQLLLEGGRSTAPVEILVGVPDGRDLGAQQRELDRQLCAGGPIRSMLEYSGARSVVVSWSGSSRTAPSPGPDAGPKRKYP
ncbi:hypothetical protein [Rhodococcus sp. NPDC058639]|uniref:hypothetical protein n=1 Tax=Rhodococcus sp. NPDC058639 TaxID=3346570 RepID=UPI003646EECB